MPCIIYGIVFIAYYKFTLVNIVEENIIFVFNRNSKKLQRYWSRVNLLILLFIATSFISNSIVQTLCSVRIFIETQFLSYLCYTSINLGTSVFSDQTKIKINIYSISFSCYVHSDVLTIISYIAIRALPRIGSCNQLYIHVNKLKFIQRKLIYYGILTIVTPCK